MAELKDCFAGEKLHISGFSSPEINLLLLERAGPLWSLQVDEAGDGGGGMSGLESVEESLSGFVSGLKQR